MTTNIQQKLKDFWEHGYTIFPHSITTQVADDVLIYANQADSYQGIFNRVYDSSPDAHRSQRDIDKTNHPAIASTKKSLRCLFASLRMQWKDKAWVILKSSAGGTEQEPHHDFPSFKTGRARNNTNSIQAGALLALQPNTAFIVFTSCFTEANPLRKTTLQLDVGDCVLFRGDLIHAGLAFQSLNFRVHCTLTVANIPWQEDATEAAPYTQFKCSYCPLRANTRLIVKNHTRFCKENTNKAKIIAQYKRNNEVTKTCDKCGATFKLKNTYNKHLKRFHNT